MGRTARAPALLLGALAACGRVAYDPIVSADAARAAEASDASVPSDRAQDVAAVGVDAPAPRDLGADGPPDDPGDAPAPAQFTLLGEATPKTAIDPDKATVELGVRFRSTVAGRILAVRFYRAATDANGYNVHLWREDGVELASIRLTPKQERIPGWQQAMLNTPVAVVAGTGYIASYYTERGQYPDDEQGFVSDVVSGPLVAPADRAGAPNGVYFYGRGGGFPTLSWRASNYFVDVVFEPTP